LRMRAVSGNNLEKSPKSEVKKLKDLLRFNDSFGDFEADAPEEQGCFVELLPVGREQMGTLVGQFVLDGAEGAHHQVDVHVAGRRPLLREGTEHRDLVTLTR
jgi:hypothetical protein